MSRSHNQIFPVKRGSRSAPAASGPRWFVFSLLALFAAAPGALAQEEPESEPARPPAPRQEKASEPAIQPFGANLFMGNFLKTREDGLNPDYVVMPGDRVSVNTWGSVQINEVFVVDGQGNIFLPEIGPVPLAGVRNAELTEAVARRIRTVYRGNFRVYTNLITASPVAVFVTGAVERPGRYAGIPSDSVLFFLDQAGGIKPRLGSYRHVVVLREGNVLAEIDLYDFILRGKLENPQFKDGDTILVEKRGPVVELKGNVASPALIEFRDPSLSGADALQVIPMAARATEVTIEGIRERVPFNRTMSVDAFHDFRLRDGDSITLRDDGRSGTILVSLEGEFEGPSLISVRRGSRLLDVLNYVPVNRRLSRTEAVHLRRLSVAKAQKDAINDSVFRLERSALLALSNSKGEAEIRVKEAELVSKFAERARLIDPLGRVVTSQEGRQLNVMLESGDTIVIPARTNVVRVGGEVLMSQAVMHKPGRTVEEYINLAGGYTDRADTDKIFILHANAEVALTDTDALVEPGDEILVPPDVDAKELQNAMDLMQIIYQVAMSAAVIIALPVW